MDKIIDIAFDILLLLMILLSFIGAGTFIVYQVLEPQQNYLWQIGALTANGIAMSYLFYWFKGRSVNSKKR